MVLAFCFKRFDSIKVPNLNCVSRSPFSSEEGYKNQTEEWKTKAEHEKA